MFPLTITTADTSHRLNLLKRFLLQQPMFYPDYDNWVRAKCIPQIKKGDSKSIIVVSNRGEVIGDAVYKTLNSRTVALKNMRIDPLFQNRDLGHFILTQLIREAGKKNIILDVTVDNFSAVEFFIRNNFQIVGKKQLYLPDQDEFIMKRNAKST